MWRTLAVVSGFVALAACADGAPPARETAPEPAPETEAEWPPAVGSVSGTVWLVGERPQPVRFNVSSDVYFEANNPGGVFDPAFAVNDDGSVPHVVLWIEGLAADPARYPVPAEPATVVLDGGALYRPHVLAVRAGQPVLFRNDAQTCM